MRLHRPAMCLFGRLREAWAVPAVLTVLVLLTGPPAHGKPKETSLEVPPPAEFDVNGVHLATAGLHPERPFDVVGRVFVKQKSEWRTPNAEKGRNALSDAAREQGADAVLDVTSGAWVIFQHELYWQGMGGGISIDTRWTSGVAVNMLPDGATPTRPTGRFIIDALPLQISAGVRDVVGAGRLPLATRLLTMAVQYQLEMRGYHVNIDALTDTTAPPAPDTPEEFDKWVTAHTRPWSDFALVMGVTTPEGMDVVFQDGDQKVGALLGLYSKREHKMIALLMKDQSGLWRHFSRGIEESEASGKGLPKPYDIFWILNDTPLVRSAFGKRAAEAAIDFCNLVPKL